MKYRAGRVLRRGLNSTIVPGRESSPYQLLRSDAVPASQKLTHDAKTTGAYSEWNRPTAPTWSHEENGVRENAASPLLAHRFFARPRPRPHQSDASIWSPLPILCAADLSDQKKW